MHPAPTSDPALERPAGPSRVRLLLRWAAAPALVFVLARLLLALARDRVGIGPTADSWIHWDALLYLDIADRGYVLMPCGAEYPPGSWCGNAGWFPGYPAVVQALTGLGVTPAVAAAAVSATCALALLVVLWVRFLGAEASARNLLLLGLAAVFPGAVYQHAGFPLSLLVLAVLVHLDLLRRRRWVLAGLAGAVAVATYPVAAVLPVTGLLGAAVLARGGRWQRVRAGLVVGALAGAGGLAVALRLRVATGHADAYLMVQEKYGHGVNPPWETVRDTVRPLWGGPGFTAETATRWQTLLVLVLVLLCLGGLARALLARRPGAVEDVPVALLLLGAWLMPLVVGSGVSLYRSEALLVPGVVLLRHLPRDATTALLVLAVPLAYVMAQLFFLGTLV